jgi:superfamily I DNA/RNA helicase
LKLVEAQADRSVVPWQILFVDEFQDSAPVDAAIYLALAPARLMVVGDPDQAIYEFRGARPANVTDYWNNPRFERHVLDLNYRCGAAICAGAQAVIEQNANRIAKVTVSATCVPGTVERDACTDEPDERRVVARTVHDWMNRGTAATEIAVLCRTNKLVTELRDHLKRAGVPLAEVESEGRPKDWRLLTLLLTLVATPGNWGVARLLAREEAKLLKTSVSDAEESVEVGRAMGRAPGAMWEFSSVAAILACNGDFHRYGVSKATHKALAERIRLTAPTTLDELLAALREPGPVVVRTGVTVSTVHAAKGTEYDCVVVAGTDQFSEDDEGRRLMFVALTRARAAVTCTSSAERTILLPSGRTLVTVHA